MENTPQQSQQPQQTVKPKTTYGSLPIAVILLCFGVIGIPVMWIYSRWSMATKITVTIVIILFTAAVIFGRTLPPQ